MDKLCQCLLFYKPHFFLTAGEEAEPFLSDVRGKRIGEIYLS